MEDGDINRILSIEEDLQTARDLSKLAREENNPSLYEAAYKLIEDNWQTIRDVDQYLDKQFHTDIDFQGSYNSNVEEITFANIQFEVELDELDEDSNPAVLGMALPKLYQELLETREYVMKKHRREGIEIDTSKYLSPQIDYLKDKDLN